jgi:alkylation response protein AidB-like acyl-CoA dehydrogenase
MTHFKVNEDDLFFILKNQLDYGRLGRLERYRELDEDTLDMTIREAAKFARGVVSPLQEIGEKWGVRFENGRVTCPPEFRRAFGMYGENGWTALSRSPEYGGQGFPRLARVVVNDLMYGACQSFNMAPSLTHGAGHLIEAFAGEDVKERYVPNMYGGRWAGTMCLTEPQAGSNLAALRTTARPENGHYQIKGGKIFISWGDHDLTENIIHLVLARIPGAPEGVKGISLFIVPKFRLNPDGSIGAFNDVTTAGVEKKLGLHASPTAALNFGDNDDCHGWLCGRENQGLAHMFQMMNAARISTGVSGLAIASTAYLNALEYSRNRVQGTDVAGRKKGFVPIIDHPDVRRMLLWMKATVDGLRSLIYTAALWDDLAHESEAEADRKKYSALVEFATPIVKAYGSDMGFRVAETAIQCLGGYGFTREYPLEQYLRDAKILSLYEGTNGIQSMDLMGRKVRMDGGLPFQAFMGEMEAFCAGAKDHPRIGRQAALLSQTSAELKETTLSLANLMAQDPVRWASVTYPMLLCFAETAVTWRLLDLATAADRQAARSSETAFLKAKVIQAAYYADTTLPLTRARLAVCRNPGDELSAMPDEGF